MKEFRLVFYIFVGTCLASLITIIFNINEQVNDISRDILITSLVICVQSFISYSFRKKEILDKMMIKLIEWYDLVKKINYYENSNEEIDEFLFEGYLNTYIEISNDRKLFEFQNLWNELGFFNYKLKKDIYDIIIKPNIEFKNIIALKKYYFDLYFKEKNNKLNIKDGIYYSNNWPSIARVELDKLQKEIFLPKEKIGNVETFYIVNGDYITDNKYNNALYNANAYYIKENINYLGRLLYNNKKYDFYNHQLKENRMKENDNKQLTIEEKKLKISVLENAYDTICNNQNKIESKANCLLVLISAFWVFLFSTRYDYIFPITKLFAKSNICSIILVISLVIATLTIAIVYGIYLYDVADEETFENKEKRKNRDIYTNVIESYLNMNKVNNKNNVIKGILYTISLFAFLISLLMLFF